MFDWFVKKIEGFFDYAFPKQCVFCGTFGCNLCPKCKIKYFQTRNRQECHVCKKIIYDGCLVHPECRESTNLDGVFICLEYNKSVLNIIEKIKYSLFHKYIEELSPYYEIKLKQEFNKGNDLLIVPVPVHKRRKWARGFNQSELIAKRIFCFESADLLIRIRNTRTQVGLNRTERLVNLDDAFTVNPKFVREIHKYSTRTIVLIDDVMTTGTTLEKCAAVLRQCGIKRVFAVTLTRG